MAQLVDYALTSLEDVKETLGIASSDTSWDNLIRRKINQATDMIEHYCGRRFKMTTYRNEEYNGTGTNQIILRNRPIDETYTFQIGYRNTDLNEDDWTDAETNTFFSDVNAGIVNLDFTSYGGWKRWRATYRAGYDTIPSDLAEACVTLASYLTINSDPANVKRKTEGQRSVEYFDPSTGAGKTGDLFDELNISQTLNAYANNPLRGK